jgi:hypothetical protein
MVSTAVSASAQGVLKQARFQVPFEFSVGEKVLPAGEYRVIGESEFIRVRSKDGKSASVALPSHRIGATRKANEVALAFKLYGDQYQLSRVWLTDGIGRELRTKRRVDPAVAKNVKTVEIIARTR